MTLPSSTPTRPYAAGWGLALVSPTLRQARARAHARRQAVASLVHSVRRPEREGAPAHERGVDGTDRGGALVRG